MMRRKRHALASTVVLALALGAAGAFVSGASGSDAIKARQDAMEDINRAMKALGAIAKKETSFDAAVVKRNAGTIADRLKKAETLFPAGSEKGDIETWAKPEIWSDAANFADFLKEAQAAAAALQAVSEEPAFRPALGKLGEACTNCHDMYRRPKN